MSPTRRRRSAIYDPAYQHMIRRLKTARRAAGLTQEQVAITLHRATNFVSRCESGERRIDPIDLFRFARLYKREITWFLPK